MTKFRKGDVVTVQGTIDSGFIADGRIKVRIEPFSDVYADLSDVKMVAPVINVGDEVAYPSEGYRTGAVLAIIDDYCWVKLHAEENKYSPLGAGRSDMRVSWPVASINRVDPPEPEQASAEEAA